MEGVGLAHLYPALAWSVCAPGHHGYPRAPDLILRKALRGRLGHQITGTTARPFLHFLNPTRRPRRVSFSFAWWCQGSAVRLNPSAYAVGRLDACFVAATLRQNGPGNPRQLISKGSSQHVVMQ